ncbi:uncharacterized protein LOC143918068 [Arctopsyche grandis]|uniref:uncharacterized protein LOC143918068 n=1 Tax=Arctopsyche grandis TaxID=121162 RepID=UPI00406D9AC6
MFGNNANVTSDLMLPIMLDIANMFRDAKDHHRAEQLNMAPQAQLLRRSFSDDDEAEPRAEHLKTVPEAAEATPRDLPTAKSMKIAAKIPSIIKNSNVRIGSNLKVVVGNEEDVDDEDDDDDDVEEDDGAEVIKGNVTVSKPEQLTVIYPTSVSNQTTEDLDALRPENSTELLSEDLPVAEKLRALNRFIDRNGNLISMQRPMWNQEALKFNLNRKNLNELLAQRRRAQLPNRQILLEMAKHKCDLFTNTLCLESIDYPALVSIKCLT